MVRDPIQRVASEYYHFKKYNDFKGDFESFYTDPRFINRQTSLLGMSLWPLLGFIGMSEEFDLSIKLINQNYRFQLPNLELNKHSEDVAYRHHISGHDLQAIRTINHSDIKLYEAVKEQFSQRIYAMENELPFFRGTISRLKNGILIGWVIPHEEERPVEVDVIINGIHASRIRAIEYHPFVGRFQSKRLGYVGFNYRLESYSPSDTIEVKISATQQQLVNSPFMVTVEHMEKI